MATIKRDNEVRVFKKGLTVSEGLSAGRYQQKRRDGTKDVFDLSYDESGKARMNTLNPESTFEANENAALRKIKPLQRATERPEIVPLPPGRDIRMQQREQIKQFLADPNIPSWRKRRFLQMNRKDI